MEILDMKATLDIGNEPYLSLLNKGIRSECLYFVPAVVLTIKPDKWINCFYRLFWEDNYLHIPYVNKSKFVCYPVDDSDNGYNAFEMKITLAEVFDFLNDATPPLYRQQLPDSTRNMDDIMALMKTFLMEKTDQTEMYQSIFQKITKYGPFTKPNVIDMTKTLAIRKYVTDGPVCTVIYANTSIDEIKDSRRVINGIFLLNTYNNKDMSNFVYQMYIHNQRTMTVCDIHRDPNSGMYIMFQYIGSMFNRIVYKSYAPFLKKEGND